MAAGTELDFRIAFDQAPIGLVISRERLMIACNQELLAMFGGESSAQLVGRSFELLYPTHEEFERTGERITASLDKRGYYADERIMKRLSGELFWCHVSGRALDPKRPHAEGLTSKRIGQRLAISPRTVDVYRARLMRKYSAATTPELVHKLLAG